MLAHSEYFNEFLSNIEPPEHRTAVAKEIPDDVRRYLKVNETFETAEPHSRLTGSYKRHTAVRNIKDVDSSSSSSATRVRSRSQRTY